MPQRDVSDSPTADNQRKVNSGVADSPAPSANICLAESHKGSACEFKIEQICLCVEVSSIYEALFCPGNSPSCVLSSIMLSHSCGPIVFLYVLIIGEV